MVYAEKYKEGKYETGIAVRDFNCYSILVTDSNPCHEANRFG